MPRFCPTCGAAADTSAASCVDCGAQLRFQRVGEGGFAAPPPIRLPSRPPPVVREKLFERLDSDLIQPLHHLYVDETGKRLLRTFIGTLVYPLGIYYLWRYTRLWTAVKLVLSMWTAIASAAIFLPPIVPSAIFGGLFFFGFTYLPLFAIFYRDASVTPRSPIRPERRVTDDRLGVIAVEEAPNAAERRLLLAREFMRVASVAIQPELTKRMSWPSRQQIAALRSQAELLLASATDPAVGYLPDPRPDDPLSAAALTAAVQALVGYLRLLEPAQEKGIVPLSEMRILVRERSRLRAAVESITGLVQQTS